MSSPSNSPAKAAPAPQSAPARESTRVRKPTREPSPVPAPSPVAAGKMHLVYPEVNPNPLLHSNFCSRLFLW